MRDVRGGCQGASAARAVVGKPGGGLFTTQEHRGQPDPPGPGPVGQALAHESVVGHVTGAAHYTGDFRLPPGVLYGWPVMAPHARARIQQLDVAAARKAPGVVAVLTAQCVPGENDIGAVRHDEPLLPVDEVSFHGQAVAWVFGESEAAARAGAHCVQATYEPLPAIGSIDEAMAAGSFLTEPLVIQRGEPEAALARSEYVLHGELRTGAQDHFYLETQVALALLDEDGQLLVHSSTQHPSETQQVIARVLGIPCHRVTVQCLRLGGGFGGKETQASAWATLAALAAWLTGRPALVRLTREQDMVLTGKRHPFLARYRAGFGSDGRVQALDLELYADGGWCLDLSEAVLSRALFHADNCYYLPHFRVQGRVVRTNTVSHTAFRGFGGPQGMVVIEEILARIAAALGLPPEQVRERNFYRAVGEAGTTPYGQTLGEERIQRIWGELLASSNFAARRVAIDAFNAGSRAIKRGLAITPVKFGISFTTTWFNQAGALVLLYQDGSIQVNHGGTEMGQGLHTKIQQVAAETLGVPLAMVRVMPTRTDKVPNTSATAASSGSDLNGAAVRQACETLKERLRPIAAAQLASLLPVSAEPVAEADVVFAHGLVFSRRWPDSTLPFAEIVRAAYRERVSLAATGYYRTPGLWYDRVAGRGRPFHYFAYGAAVSEVEVDSRTGEWTLLRVDILHDAGDSLNPLIDRGQVEGGFVQGMGWLTMEQVLWDTDGRLLTRGPSTYKIPTIADVPKAFHVRLLPKAAQPGVINGSKAVGEPPLMLAISVREALRDAISAFAPHGERRDVSLACPSTCEAILEAVRATRTPRHSGLPWLMPASPCRPVVAAG